VGTAIAALTYRFLGGIPPDTSFSVGALKLGGTFAALIGSAWLINGPLEKQTKDLKSLFRPDYEQWIAISRTSESPIEVEVIGFDKMSVPDKKLFSEKELSIEIAGRYFKISPKQDPSFPLGKLSPDDLNALESVLFLGDRVENFIVTDRLRSGTPNCPLGQLPIRLSTKSYSDSYSNVALVNREGNEILECSLQGREAKIVEVNQRYYLLGVVEVNHQPESGEPYAKFAVGEIRPKVALNH
jgi:hypothetical protein